MNGRRTLVAGLPAGLALALVGCASGRRPDAAAAATATEPAKSGPPTPPQAAPGRRPRLALALGGGAARGFAHVGVVEALERAGLRPDLIVGTSAGSLVGALYASGLDGPGLHRAALSLEEGVLGDWTLTGRGLLRGRALQDLVNRLVASRPIERFAIPYAAVVTDLYNGRAMLLRQGDAGVAVRASSAVPGVFEPVSIGGREYVDGGLSSPVPVRAARGLGADVVVAVDIAAQPRFQETDTLPRVLLQTFAIMASHLADNELREADVVIRPSVGDLSSADFSQRALAIAEGERAALAALAAIRAALANRAASH